MSRLKYGEETVIVPFRCPESRVKEFREKVYRVLDGYIGNSSESLTEIPKPAAKPKTTKTPKPKVVKKKVVKTVLKKQPKVFSKGFPINELPITVVPYMQSNKIFTNKDQTSWYTKTYKNGSFEIMIFENIQDAKEKVQFEFNNK